MKVLKEATCAQYFCYELVKRQDGSPIRDPDGAYLLQQNFYQDPRDTQSTGYVRYFITPERIQEKIQQLETNPPKPGHENAVTDSVAFNLAGKALVAAIGILSLKRRPLNEKITKAFANEQIQVLKGIFQEMEGKGPVLPQTLAGKHISDLKPDVAG